MRYQERIRNFSIIAHIDHGKSTLADRLLEITNTVDKRDLKEQMLDSMDIERERGITIQSQTVTLEYKARSGEIYSLNLIDTPGHVDFTYEVSRSLLACEGALLIIDASQGVEAQTLANMYLALEHNLELLPVINKIDLPSADVDMVLHQIDHDLGLNHELAVQISAKEGTNIEEVLENIITHCPYPKGDPTKPLNALIFGSYYDPYKGVIVSIRVFEGTIKKGDAIKLFASDSNYDVDEVGVFKLRLQGKDELKAGEVGYLIAGIKNISHIKIGDTITHQKNGCDKPLPGFKEVKPMVFSGIFPVEGNDYELLKDALEKLKLNDASLVYEPDSSIALGFGFRCGFLGLLHLEIIQERLEREFNLDLVCTFPSVKYMIYLTDKTSVMVDNPANFPERVKITKTEEPYVNVSIITPQEYLGGILQLCLDKRGIQKNMVYLDEKRVQIEFEMPLSEIIYDFHDKLKSITKGYASYDYNLIDYRESDLIRLDILVNDKKVDALSQIIHKDKAYTKGRLIVEKLKETIPRQMFKIPLQASIEGKIIAREDISALRKNVTAKCYGGDISRKRKLLEKQKAGKKRMRMVGDVEIPQEAFRSVLKTD